MLKTGSISNGSIFFTAVLVWPWPPDRSINISCLLDDGRADILMGPAGRIVFQLIRFADGMEIPHEEVWSARLRFHLDTFVSVGIGWDQTGKGIRIFVNGYQVGNSMDSAFAHRVIRIPRPMIGPVTDYRSKNLKALTQRRGKFNALSKTPDRFTGGISHLVSSLRDEMEQIDSLISLVEAGKLSHIRGISSRLRLLVVRHGQYPLLQTTAAAYEAALIIYTMAHPRHPLQVENSTEFRQLVISSKPNALLRNPVDFDVWLT